MSGWDKAVISLATFLPVFGAIVIVLVPKDRDRLIRALGILFTGAALIVGIVMLFQFDYGQALGLQFQVNVPWIPVIGARYHVGMDGISHCPAVVGDNGFAGGLNGSEHARGIGSLLTARPLGTGTFQSFQATSGWGSGISIDQHLADVLAPPTTFKTLELGVHVRDSEVRGRISYTGADQPVPPREDPAELTYHEKDFLGGITVSSYRFLMPS